MEELNQRKEKDRQIELNNIITSNSDQNIGEEPNPAPPRRAEDGRLVMIGEENYVGYNLIFQWGEGKILGGKGSPEYTQLKESLEAYGRDETFNWDKTWDLFNKSWNYLSLKDTTPWHDYGKKRVAAAARVMAQTAADLLQTDMSTEKKTALMKAVTREVLRSPIFRDTLMEELPEIYCRKGKGSEKALDLCAYIGAVNTSAQVNHKSILVPGKVADPGCQERLDAQIRFQLSRSTKKDLQERMSSMDPDQIRHEAGALPKLMAEEKKHSGPSRDREVIQNTILSMGGLGK